MRLQPGTEQRKVLNLRMNFLSNLKKTDRLHPVVSLCVYYGENEWDGPFCLTDMLEIPEKLKPLVSDYKMNLIEVRNSEPCVFITRM